MFKGRWQGERKDENRAASGNCWDQSLWGEGKRHCLPCLCLRCKSGVFRNAQKKASLRTYVSRRAGGQQGGMLHGVEDSLVASPDMLEQSEEGMLAQQEQPGRAELLPSSTCSLPPEPSSPL